MNQERRESGTPTANRFWEGYRQHVLLIPQCSSCGSFHFSWRLACPKCWTREFEWVHASGRGYLLSYIIRGGSRVSGARHSIIGVIQLDEGVRILALLRDVEAEPSSPAIGKRVYVCFEEEDDEGAELPVFAVEEEGR